MAQALHRMSYQLPEKCGFLVSIAENPDFLIEYVAVANRARRPCQFVISYTDRSRALLAMRRCGKRPGAVFHTHFGTKPDLSIADKAGLEVDFLPWVVVSSLDLPDHRWIQAYDRTGSTRAISLID